MALTVPGKVFRVPVNDDQCLLANPHLHKVGLPHHCIGAQPPRVRGNSQSCPRRFTGSNDDSVGRRNHRFAVGLPCIRWKTASAALRRIVASRSAASAS